MTLVPGAKLGPYEITSRAGAGGMGEVYKARDTRLNRTVAIKVLPPKLTTDPAAKQRFEREAHAVAALSHPHICPLFDVGHQDGTDFLVMEFLDGETLAARLARGKLPFDTTLQYGIQITDGVNGNKIVLGKQGIQVGSGGASEPFVLGGQFSANVTEFLKALNAHTHAVPGGTAAAITTPLILQVPLSARHKVE